MIAIAAALAADATGVRFETAAPGGDLTVPALGGNPGDLDAGLTFTRAGESAVAHWSDGSEQVLLDGALVLDVAAGWVPHPRVRVEAGLPVVAGAAESAAEIGLIGDPWVAASWAAEAGGLLTLGPRVRVGLPGSGATLISDGTWTGDGSLVAVATRGGTRVAIEAGIGGRAETPLGGEGVPDARVGSLLVHLGSALSPPPVGPVRFGVELASTAVPLGGDDLVGRSGAELLAHATIDFGRADLVAGGGLGMGPAYGVPSQRVFAMIRGHLLVGEPEKAPDRDTDGLVDAEDRCADAPEDRDGYRDDDGCPDDDDDADGVPDGADACPRDPEDRDGVADEDGCADLDNDHDGVTDAADACPTDAGPPAREGCPDRDGDGIDDRQDACPEKPGVAPSGCPVRVRVTAARIEIDERVFFDIGKATIREVSFPLLRDVAEAVNAHPEILRVQVAGHTDADGDAAVNLALSQARAESVRTFLVTYGNVDGGRLEARGYGETIPIADNETEDGRSRNRRVEFVILARK